MADTLTIEITADDLPLHCPTENTPLWCLHPRVFLDVQRSGEAVCPYCSTRYVFKGSAPQAH